MTNLFLKRMARVMALPVVLLGSNLYAGGLPQDVSTVLGTTAAYAIPIKPMKARALDVIVAPGYFQEGALYQIDTSEGHTIDLEGWGGGVSVSYGFTEHWGVNFMMTGVEMDGRRDFHPEASNGLQLDPDVGSEVVLRGHATTAELSGKFVSLTAIYDFGSGDGFRMPIFFGVNYIDMEESSDYKTFGLRSKGGNQGMGITFVLTPQFNVWKMRLSPFMLLAGSLEATNTETLYDLTSGATIKEVTYDVSSGDAHAKAVGIDICYRPWNLSTIWIPDIASGTNAYTLRWSHRWGG